MTDTLSKLLKKLEDINSHVDKKIASKKLFKDKYEDIDDSIRYARKLQKNIDIINEANSNAVDMIEQELTRIQFIFSWVTGPVHESKELLEVFIGKYRKAQDRMDVFNHDE